MSTIKKHSDLIMIRNHAYSILSGAQYFAGFNSVDKKLISKLISTIDHQFLVDLQAMITELEVKPEALTEAQPKILAEESQVLAEIKAAFKDEQAKLQDSKAEDIKEEQKAEQPKAESKKDKKPGFKRV